MRRPTINLYGQYTGALSATDAERVLTLNTKSLVIKDNQLPPEYSVSVTGNEVNCILPLNVPAKPSLVYEALSKLSEKLKQKFLITSCAYDNDNDKTGGTVVTTETTARLSDTVTNVIEVVRGALHDLGYLAAALSIELKGNCADVKFASAPNYSVKNKPDAEQKLEYKKHSGTDENSTVCEITYTGLDAYKKAIVAAVIDVLSAHGLVFDEDSRVLAEEIAECEHRKFRL